jgi:hypothetical protein
MLFASVQTALAWLLSIVGHQQVKERMVDSDLDVEVLAAKRAALMERARLVFERSHRAVEESRKVRAIARAKHSASYAKGISEGLEMQPASSGDEASVTRENN